MKKYSVKKNLDYMLMTFFKPKLLIDFFIKDSTLLYSIVPLILFIIFYGILYLLSYLSQSPVMHPFPKILPIPDSQYRLYEIFFVPFVHILFFVIFGIIIYGLSKLLRFHKVNPIKVIYFFLFVFNTIGLVAAIIDLLIIYKCDFGLLAYIHPICALIYTAYIMEFIHKQAEISRLKSLVLCIPAVVVSLFFRILFIR